MRNGQIGGSARAARRGTGWIWIVCVGIAACVGEIPERQGGSAPGAVPPGSAPIGPNGLPVGPGQVPGQLPGQVPGQVPLPAAASCAAPDASELPLQRLSSLEYQLSLQDLFQLPAPPAIDSIPPDTNKDGFKTFAVLQAVSAQHLRGYLEVATRLADELLVDTQRRSKVIGCKLDAADCLPAFITRFGRLAYRRTLDATEVSALAKAAMDNALDVNDRYRYAIESVLVSPNFLYRVEVGDRPEGLATLSGEELAARLSFALWGRGPSLELLEQGKSGMLNTVDGLRLAADKLAADPRTRQYFDSFFKQWLGFEQLRAPKQPPADWNDALLADMQRETSTVLDELAFGGRDFLDALTINTTRVTPALAKFYSLPAPAADGTVTFPANHPRANTGVLTHASLLGAKSDGDRIALRGNWLRRTFLCRNLQVPPEIAEQFGELLVGLTRVEIVKKRNTEAACMGCHAAIDPIGVGFDRFDEAGRFDPMADPAKYGIASALPDAPNPNFSTVAELSNILRGLPEVSACLTSRVFLYTNGREPQASDACSVGSAAATFDQSKHDFRALVRGLVAAPTFRLRRAPAPTL